MEQQHTMTGTYLCKRLFDTIIAFILLLIVAPILFSVASLILLLDGRPVLFVQNRPGLRGRPFGMIKFRSMTNATDAAGNLLPAMQRLTRLGAFLRRTSLDELPELLNVVRGDMSLVGPRPLLMQYLPLYTREQMRRHEVKPGMTGLAQVNGRNKLTWEEKFAFDIWYVDNVSLAIDLKIMWRTIICVCDTRDVNEDSFDRTDHFSGSNACQNVTYTECPPPEPHN